VDNELLRYKSMDAEKLAAELDYFFRQNYEKYSSYFHNPSEKEKDLYDKLMQGRFVGIKKLLEDMGQGEHSYLMNRLTQHENNYPMDLYLIYQIKREFARDYLFEKYDNLQKRGLSVDSDNYELMYSAEFTPADTLEDIMVELNLNHPSDYRGHSLSVSDIIVLRENEKETAYYCDGTHLREVPEFFKEPEIIVEPKDEKELRSDLSSPTDVELDMCFDIAFNIDEHLRKNSPEYRTLFPDIDEQTNKELIADAMLTARTVAIKKMLSEIEHENSSALLKQLAEYEKAYPKNHFEIYTLKAEYRSNCPYAADKQRANRDYINRDMYEIIASVPMSSDKTPMQIEATELIRNSFTNDRYVPDTRDIIVTNFNGIEKAYFRERKEYVEVPEFVGVHIRSAVISNYRGYTAFVGTDDKVYLGRSENYLHNKENGFLPFYNNTDNSLLFISDNEKMYSFLYGSGWIVSQQEMIEHGAFSLKDYAEYAALKDGILSGLDKIREIKFDGKSFSYPVFDRTKKASIRKQLAENKSKDADVPKAPARNKNNDLEV